MKGDVRLRVECLVPEQLLRRALAEGARFSGVRRIDGRTLIVDTDGAGARRLQRLCGRFSIPAAVVRRRGANAARAYLKRRATLPVGLLVCALLCALFLGRIWRVDVRFTGDAAALGDRPKFLHWLDVMGVRPGTSNGIDCERLSQQLQAVAGDYSFVGARVQGVRLLVEAAPEVPAPPVYDVDAARDLVARQDGIVVSASARAGTLCVGPGDTVRRGQLLIRGEEKVSEGETRPISALGEVVMRCWYAGEASLPASAQVTRATGRTRIDAVLRIAALQWPLSTCEGFDSQRVETQVLPIGGLFAPVEIVRRTYREICTETRPIDETALRARLRALAFSDAALNLSRNGPPNYTVERTWINYERTGGALCAQAVYEITTDAAVTRDALLQGG